ncbi:acetylxylan esterase [Granulicella sp. dw_53]|uniref:alpha/beta hydrolase family protein n=1 Tax=Granulicella sp. dw_53 TaxID=2719792 RepID=UPI001BD6CD60|nr:acetylxylan esterase [Granulicella sp. dw_53]
MSRFQNLPLSLLLVAAVSAQSSIAQTAAAPVQLTAEQDHQRLMDTLHITTLRAGADAHNPAAPNAVNYDESKANPYVSLPDPLTLNDGKKVTSARVWWSQRHPELVELFDREVIGRVPAHTPKVTWQVVSTSHDTQDGIPTLTKHLLGHVDNSAYPAITVDIRMTLTTPANATHVPVILEFTFENYPRRTPAPSTATPPPPPPPVPAGPSWKQQLLAKGWGYALLEPTTIQADNGAGLTQGIIGLCNHGQPRKPDDWGALRAWAWGGSRALDYFATDKDVDAKHVGVEGHSRFGKTALVAMAYEPRFVVAYVSSSGAGGATLARRHFGEQLENVAAANEYHWMAGNYIKYAATLTPQDMPVDMHELIALCAPRPVFIGGGATEGDGWADAHGTFIAEVAAGPVYRLLGKRDLGTTVYPTIETPLIAGDLAFRQHSGGHTPAPNWPTFITFATPYLKSPSY